MAEHSVQSGKYDAFLERGIIPRFGKPEDVARTILFLLEPTTTLPGKSSQWMVG
jgi:NAD(P)-dependent dehydrogenase (short-subunit alcohol dehydrogenase family)